ncbi:MAG: SpoIIE family protein phosphatase [Ignavibacteriae bacterium]|nr:SpoIIE family protein phosphatase [Ignavibacteriota bacterium]
MPIKMLVVDDEPDLELLIRQKFRKQIRENEYEFVFAQHGLAALAKMAEHPEINLILSDINMPEMDGLTLLSKIGELQNPALKAVIVSAYGDMENIRTAMNRGAFDFVTKPIDFTDLEVTINKTIRQLHIIKQAMKEHEQLIAFQQDLNIAARIQQSILPRTFPPFPDRKEFDIYATMVPAKEVGGDFYYFFFLDDDHLAVVVGDVSGKGIPAAIFMALSRTVLKAIASRVENPGECLRQVNEMLIPESDSAMFVTIFYAVLNTNTGEFTFSNGGHNPPYIVSTNGDVTPLEYVGGPIIGKIPGLPFDSTTITLKPGDAIFMYTDGVTEAMNPGKDLFEEPRLIECLSQGKDKQLTDLLQCIHTELKTFAATEPQSDDITMLSLRYLGNGM